jgi:hypothetical protein
MARSRRIPLLFATLISLSLKAVAQNPSSHPTPPDAVWVWSKNCEGSKGLDVTLRLRSKVIHHSVIPICLGSRDAESGRVEVKFPGNLLFRGQVGQEEADVWQAGGESDALILGLSLQGTKRIHLNTLYIAKPDQKSSSSLGYGLTMVTIPVTIVRH